MKWCYNIVITQMHNQSTINGEQDVVIFLASQGGGGGTPLYELYRYVRP